MSVRVSIAKLLRLLAALCFLVAVFGAFRVSLGLAVPADWLARLPTIGQPFDRAAPGFMLRMTSTPTGVGVRIDGVVRGTTPWLGNVVCRQDDPIVLEMYRAGYHPWTQTVLCREGSSLDVPIPLDPAR